EINRGSFGCQERTAPRRILLVAQAGRLYAARGCFGDRSMNTETTHPPRLARPAFLLVLLVLLSVLAGCSRSTENKGAGERRVKLALDWVPEPEFGGFFAAREGGAFKHAGFDVEIMSGGAGVPVVQMVAAGHAEFGIASGDEVIIARSRGADVI